MQSIINRQSNPETDSVRLIEKLETAAKRSLSYTVTKSGEVWRLLTVCDERTKKEMSSKGNLLGGKVLVAKPRFNVTARKASDHDHFRKDSGSDVSACVPEVLLFYRK
jgi:hypothetical protein